MKLNHCCPFLRFAMIQPSVLEGEPPRLAYDHRIFMVLEGNGEIFLDNAWYSLKTQDLIFVQPRIRYFFRGKMKVLVLNFDMTRKFENERQARQPMPESEFVPEQCFDTATVEELDSFCLLPADSRMVELAMAMVARHQSADVCADAACSAMIKLLLAEILGSAAAPRDAKGRLAEQVLFYIRSNAPEITGNEMIGKYFGYHSAYIAAVVKEKTGKTLHRLVIEERIRLACLWLRATDQSVEQIAHATGFSSRNHFCTVFKSVMKMPPLALRSKREWLPETEQKFENSENK